MAKYFPIQTATACQAKWNWSTLYLYQGTTASCHRTGWSDLTADSFATFHNTDKKLQERQAMLQGQWPADSCGYCKTIEEQGGQSDRHRHRAIPNMSPIELDQNAGAIKVSPSIVEVYFDNTCNLACLYCIPTLSSKINQENIRHGEFSSGGVHLTIAKQHSEYQDLLKKFWQWMHDHSTNLRRLHVLGGEPFYQREFYQLLNFFEQNPRPGLELNLVTNLMIDTEKLQSTIAKFRSLLAKRHLGRVDLTCSIDCWGVEQEYVRWGIDLDLWQTNFESLLLHKWLKLNINQTISVLTVKTMPQLLTKLDIWRQQHKIEQFFSEVEPQPLYMRPGILGPGIFDKDFDSILGLMPTDTEQNSAAKEYMQGIASRIASSSADDEQKHNLRVFLDEKDRRRNTSWKATFPWLEKELKNVV